MLVFAEFLLAVLGLVSSVVWATSVFEIIGATTEVYVWYWMSFVSLVLRFLLMSWRS